MSQEEKIDSNAWMITFADLVMLLLTFFVMLLTMSSMDSKKLKNLMTNFREATGVLEFSGSGKVSDLPSFITKYNSSDSLIVVDQEHFIAKLKIVAEINDMLKEIHKEITLSDDERGIVLSFNENILFDIGKASLRKKVLPVLDAIADTIESCSNDILIMGHTDNTPIKNDLYPSNWELSAYRGISVLEYFLGKEIPPERFAVGGYGSSRPKVPNDTFENRSLNRKVEIIFKPLEEA